MKIAAFVFASLLSLSAASADALSEEMERFLTFSKCPQGVTCTRWLDGGTMAFEIRNSDSESYELCLDGRRFYSPDNPEDKYQKVYLRCQRPDSPEALALPFKGEEEELMKAMIRSWIECGEGADTRYLESFLVALKEERIKKPMTHVLTSGELP